MASRSRSRSRGHRKPRRTLAAAIGGPVLTVALVAACGGASGAGRASTTPGQVPPTGAGRASTAPRQAPPTADPAAAAAAAVQQSFVSVIRRVLPSVVEIRTNAGLGSGVVLDSEGDIVTNAHVVSGASRFQVLSASSVPIPAVLVGSCPADDLAVIRVSASAGLHPARFGDLAAVTVGDLVLAIGSPLGLGGSVTEGIVSAIGRSVAEPVSAGAPAAVLADAIQTSAAINPGNSGGALVSIDGEVIGIPTLAAVNRTAGGAAPGIGFAIPASVAVRVGRGLAGGGADTASLPSGCHR